MTEESGFELFSKEARPALREELESAIAPAAENGTPELREMVSYQLGWSGENAGAKAEGKQIRPLLALLACQGAGGRLEKRPAGRCGC